MAQGFSTPQIGFAGNGITQIFINGTKQATTSGTEIDFTVPAGIKEFKITTREMSLSGTASGLLQLGDAGGIETTGYLGNYGYLANAANSLSAQLTTGLGINSGAASIGITCVIHGVLHDAATNEWVISLTGTRSDGGTVIMFGATGKSLSGELTTIRVTTTNGTDTFDNGSVNLQYDNPDPTVLANLNSGAVVQTVNSQDGEAATGTTNFAIGDTIPQNTDGDEYLSASITPTNVGNKLRIDVTLNMTNSVAQWGSMAVFQDSTADALAMTRRYVDTGERTYPLVLTYWMDAGTTSSTTFKVRAGNQATGTFAINGSSSGTRAGGGVMYSQITITEYAA